MGEGSGAKRTYTHSATRGQSSLQRFQDRKPLKLTTHLIPPIGELVLLPRVLALAFALLASLPLGGARVEAPPPPPPVGVVGLREGPEAPRRRRAAAS